MAYYICRSVLPSRFVTRQAMFLQPQNFAINSNPALFQLSILRSYTNSTSPPPSPQDYSSSSSYLNKFAKATAKRLPTVIIWKLVVGGVITLISGDLLYAGYRNWHNKRLLNKTVEKGTQPKIDVSDEEFVPRPLVIDRLKQILQPNRNQSHYHVICGEHGTGKTLLTRKASREVGQGVIYVEIPSDAEDIEPFGIAFGESLNFAFEERISFTAQLMKKILGDFNGKDERPKWKRALEAFKRAGAVYKEKHNKPPVIVYDNIAKLINVNPKVLDTLQDDAKMNVDRREYVAVFVSSEGSVPQRMESRSAWSRAKKPVMEIGDLNKEESMEYLVKKRSIKEEDAKKLYDMVGGRIVNLQTVADDFLAGQKFETIKQSILDEVEKKFKTAQLYQDQQLHEVGKLVINALLNSKELSYLEFRRIFKSIAEAREFDPDETLGKNVFAYHPEKNTVTFQSQSVEYYIREKSSIYIV